MKTRLLFILTLQVLLSSCFKQECVQRKIAATYSGFSGKDLSVAVVKRYSPNSGLSTLIYIDTIAIIAEGVLQTKGPEPFSYVKNNHPGYAISISENYDWVIELPLANRTDKITGIDNKDQKNRNALPSGGGSYDYCVSELSYKLNGTKTTLPKIPEGSERTPVPAVITINK